MDVNPPAGGARHVLDLIGNTPLMDLSRLLGGASRVRLLGKAEFMNPGGSVKDRPALNMVREGERSGQLTKEKTLLDATSGNTGIAYAMIGAALGYRVKLCVPRNIGEARKRMLEAYGADLVLTDPHLGSDGAIQAARRLHAGDPARYFYPDQYSNPANWQAHYKGTAVEILRQAGGDVTHFVAALGTSGTFMGTSRRLREHDARVRLISVEPDSPFHGLEGMKHMATSLVPAIYDPSLADEAVGVSTEDAQDMCRRLAVEQGLLVGVSAGAAVVAALRVAETLDNGTVVTILCDGGVKYLDMQFWKK